MDFIIDKEIRDYMPPAGDVCDSDLETSIIANGGAKEALLVAKLPNGQKILYDGHRRYAVCDRLGLDYAVELREVANRDEIFRLMDEIQSTRRNLDHQQLSMVRCRLGKPVAGGKTKAVKEAAAKAGVSERTIWRDKEYMEAVEKLAPDIREEVVAKKSKKDVVEIAKLPKEKQVEATKAPKSAGPEKILGIWCTTVAKLMNGSPGIDELKAKHPGPYAEQAINAARNLYDSLTKWRKAMK